MIRLPLAHRRGATGVNHLSPTVDKNEHKAMEFMTGERRLRGVFALLTVAALTARLMAEWFSVPT